MSEGSMYKSERGRLAILRTYRELLDDWPVPATRRTVETSLGQAFVLESGPQDGPPLVLLHGSGTNTAMWRAEVPEWSRHHRVLALDLPGEPGLSAQVRPALDSDAHARWLDEVFDHLGLRAPAVVGASLGAWVALDLAVRRPSRVGRLVLLCPAGIGGQKYGWLLPVILLRMLGRWGRRRSVVKVAGLTDEAFLDYLTEIYREFRPRTERLPVFTDVQLAGLPMPVLAIAGERDAMFDTAETARRLRKAPGATVRVLPGVGHSVVRQAEAVSAFLVKKSTVE
ncbi:alpha/beta fold hydrolase [Saccharopolyspora mangrovi]|uniref:Alpha/beta fold hydrolase n=1 Tax=Saccharopolyspora mangrovi TaxID=3082379 RepID=A0ABU6AIY2_9PSEU|nr:alpha/beta fold hydrolase [Saccharopolyspora sp. S2-29]MEB3371448.1 alpha/beta fold hydrolase [Saccharopolyspora sp. S2-29]